MTAEKGPTGTRRVKAGLAGRGPERVRARDTQA